jgi:thiaminase (transcriptional activator TenA)
MRRFAALAHAVLETEMDLHRRFAARWGITVEQLETERPAPATAAYCDFLLRTAALGDFAELAAALLPCMWSYAEIGERLTPTGRYAEWIEMYASAEFQELATWARELTDAVAGDRRRMHAAFRASTEHEVAFWESAWIA